MDTRIITLTPPTIDAINEELAYTATLSAQERSDEIYYATPGQLCTLQVYAARATEAWVTNPGNQQALNELRKCAAIAIRALEIEGCPRRFPI